MPRQPIVLTLLALSALAACHRGVTKAEKAAQTAQPFSSFVAQRIVFVPTGSVRGGDSLGWVQSMGGSRSASRQLDSAIARALDDRGLSRRWVMPADLARAFERNRSYATDPYLLAMEPLRLSTFKAGSKYTEPLSTQLRTMIALEEDARFVFLPIELKFEKVGAGMRGLLRAAFVDPRTAEARWVGEVRGDPAPAAAAALLSVGQKIADLFVAP